MTTERQLLIINGAHSTSARALAAAVGERYDLRLLSRRGEPPPEGLAENHRHARVDATNGEAVAESIGRVIEERRPIAGYVHMIGSVLLKPLHLTTPEEWDETMAVNVRTIYLGLRPLMPTLMKQKHGAVVLVSSVAARVGLANHEAISAAKGAVQALVPSLASTYAAHGIRVNGVSPGLVRAPMSAKLVNNEINLKASLALTAVKRTAEGADIAAAVEFLLDPACSGYVTGQILSVDGGMSTVRTPPKL